MDACIKCACLGKLSCASAHFDGLCMPAHTCVCAGVQAEIALGCVCVCACVRARAHACAEGIFEYVLGELCGELQ